MPYCQRCGTKLEEGAHFCHKCGNPAVTFAPPPSPPAIIRPIRNDPLLVAGIVIAIVISALIIGVIIFLAFNNLNFGQNNANQQNFNTLYLFTTTLHKQMPLLLHNQ